MTIRVRNQPVPSNPDRSREIGDDIAAIAESIPSIPRGFAQLRQLIGLLPNPIGPTFPNHPPVDPDAGQTAPATSGVVGTPFGYGVQGSGQGGVFNISTIDGSQIADGTVTGGPNGTIATGSITGDNVQANSISADKIQANSITASQLAVGSVTGVQLADGTISDVEISSISANKITTGTLQGINIIAGGGGNDGFHVADGSGTQFGSWTSLMLEAAVIYSDSSIFATTTVSGAQGVSTAVVSGIGSAPSTNSGMMYIDISSSPARFYFRYSGGWHYVNQTAGFGIPAYEARCPACGELILPDQDLIGVASALQHDGAVHGLWKHLSCAGKPLGPLAARYEAAASDTDLQAELEAEVRAAQDAAGADRPQPLGARIESLAVVTDPGDTVPPPPDPAQGTKVTLSAAEAQQRQDDADAAAAATYKPETYVSPLEE